MAVDNNSHMLKKIKKDKDIIEQIRDMNNKTRKVITIKTQIHLLIHELINIGSRKGTTEANYS